MRHLFRLHQYYNNNKLVQLVFIKDVICQCSSKVNKNNVRLCGFKDLYCHKLSRMASEILILDQRVWNILKRKDKIYPKFSDSIEHEGKNKSSHLMRLHLKRDYSESSSVRNKKLRSPSHAYHLKVGLPPFPFREALQNSKDDYPHKKFLHT